VSETLKVCAAEGCETVLPTYKLHDTLCHEHGRQKAKQTRKKQYDPGELEAFRRALLEETLVSLIRDPSRWSWESGGLDGGWEGRARPSGRADNTCPGWMCRTLLDAPLPPGQHCSAECKHRTLEAREAFRRELTQLRAAAKRREAVVA